MQKADMLPIFAKRLETKETTDQLVQAFRVFDRQNRGKFLAYVLMFRSTFEIKPAKIPAV